LHGTEYILDDEHILLNLEDDDGPLLVPFRGVRDPAVNNKVLAYVMTYPQVDSRRVDRGFEVLTSEPCMWNVEAWADVGVELSRRGPRSR
jgi:hypothetical protein